MLKTPDISTAQIVGFATSILTALVVLFKLDLSDAQTGAIIAIIGALAPVGLFVSDAIIRHGRATGNTNR